MGRRHLFGPAPADFAREHLHRYVEAGECVVFDHGGVRAATFGDSWDDFVARLPTDWRPEFIVLRLQYNAIPPFLWQAPVPIIGFAGDWNLVWHHYRNVLPRCDLVLTDAAGVETLARAGIMHARHAQLFGCERSFVDFDYDQAPRDIDVLFVGNFSPAVQRERLPWLGRIAKLRKRWSVHITSGVFGDDYRRLLGRARIVFNRSIRGECNNRLFEGIAAGALVFQEADNRETKGLLREGDEYVSYDETNLEDRIEHYLTHEDERSAIAERAHRRRHEFTFEAMWQRLLDTVESNWQLVQQRAQARYASLRSTVLIERTAQAASAAYGMDQTLPQDLQAAIEESPNSASLQCALALSLWQHTPQGLGPIARALQAAWQCDPRYVLAGLNLAEVLVLLGDPTHAFEQCQRVLALLNQGCSFSRESANAAWHIPDTYDTFRVEWERASWLHAGDHAREVETKTRLVRWRLYMLLGSLTGDPIQFFQAVSARPDLAVGRSELGHALARAKRHAEAAAVLEEALQGNPFETNVARGLHQLYGLIGHTGKSVRLASEQRCLHLAAPTLIPEEEWFADGQLSRATIPADRAKLRIVWHGDQQAFHSLSLVNRELCVRLLERGHELSLREPQLIRPLSRCADLPDQLRARLGAALSGGAHVHISHQWPPDFTPPDDGHWVMIQPWEYGSIPRAWLDPLRNLVDELWVPSRFVRNSFIGSGVPAEKVHIVPNGVSAVFFEEQLPYPLRTAKRFKFLFVGGTIARKGIDLLLKAYTQVFADRDDVCLVIKDMGVGTFYQGQTAEALIAEARARPHAPEIEYLDGELSQAEMAGLYRACDCLVHPYRGEGFGLPIAEALASGIPVIVTAFGAALDFCNDENAYFVPARVEMLDRGRGELETVNDQFWAQPDPDYLRFLLRHVVDHPQQAREKAALGREFIREHFTWEHSASAVEARLHHLCERPVWRPSPMSVARSALSANGKQTVTLTMIVRNEEKNLAACLQTVADLVDEMVIVDTGSTDRTKDIARQFGAKVYDFPWIDHFAAARNESLRHATGDWVFWLDADDRLSDANREKLRSLLATLPRGVMLGHVMKCECLPQPGQVAPTIVDHVRLFPNHPGLRWKYRVHEQILGSIRRLGGQVVWTDVAVQHVGYQDAVTHKGKGERNLRLLLLDNQECPDDPFILFNLGNMLQEHGRYEESLRALRRSLELSEPADSIVRKLYTLICQNHRLLGQHAAALQACLEGRSHYPSDVELLWEEGFVRDELGDIAGAIACHRRILEPSDDGQHFASVDQGKKGFRTRYQLGCWLKKAGRLQEAEEQWRSALDEVPDFLPALHQLIDLGLEQRRLDLVEEMIRRTEHSPHGRVDAMVHRARVYLLSNDFAEARQLLERSIADAPNYVFPCLILSRMLLQEGRDWAAAEHALRRVLTLVPDHPEAKNNLQVLLQRRVQG